MFWMTFSPFMPSTALNDLAIANHKPIEFQFTYETARYTKAGLICALAATLLITLGARACIRASATWRGLAIVSLIVIIFNVLLHSFWGTELFVYSQHWHTSLVILVAGLLVCDSAAQRSIEVAFGLAVLACAGQTFVVINAMLHAIANP
jgi:hypothetical protein